MYCCFQAYLSQPSIYDQFSGDECAQMIWSANALGESESALPLLVHTLSRVEEEQRLDLTNALTKRLLMQVCV